MSEPDNGEELETETDETNYIQPSTAHKTQKPRGTYVRRKLHRLKLLQDQADKQNKQANNRLKNLPYLIKSIEKENEINQNEINNKLKEDKAIK